MDNGFCGTGNHGQPLFATATVNELCKAAQAEGLGDSDFAAVCRVIRP